MSVSGASEKRKHQRLAGTYIVSYKVQGSSANFGISRTVNIGRGGMLFTAERPLEKGTRMTFVIKGPFFLEGMELSGSVIDCREAVKGSIYETRVQFSDPGAKQLDRLDEFITRRMGIVKRT